MFIVSQNHHGTNVRFTNMAPLATTCHSENIWLCGLPAFAHERTSTNTAYNMWPRSITCIHILHHHHHFLPALSFPNKSCNWTLTKPPLPRLLKYAADAQCLPLLSPCAATCGDDTMLSKTQVSLSKDRRSNSNSFWSSCVHFKNDSRRHEQRRA